MRSQKHLIILGLSKLWLRCSVESVNCSSLKKSGLIPDKWRPTLSDAMRQPSDRQKQPQRVSVDSVILPAVP